MYKRISIILSVSYRPGNRFAQTQKPYSSYYCTYLGNLSYQMLL